jgi:hypothetical protein
MKKNVYGTNYDGNQTRISKIYVFSVMLRRDKEIRNNVKSVKSWKNQNRAMK